jgi:hypothetical protein
MKKIYMTMVAMLCGVAAMAQDNETCTISVDLKGANAVEIAADGELYPFDVLLNESVPGQLVTGVSFQVQFPENVFFYYYDEDEEDYVYKVEYPNAKNGHQKMMIIVNENQNIWQINSAAAGATYFKTSTNVCARLYIKATPEAAANSEIKFSEISFSRPDPAGGVYAQSCYPQEPFSVALSVEGGTGINSINADDNNAPIYNVAGQRVSKAQKGIFIQNGKKVAVK